MSVMEYCPLQACFGILEENDAPPRHVCDQCADPASLCTDPRLVTSDLDQVRMQCVLILLRSALILDWSLLIWTRWGCSVCWCFFALYWSSTGHFWSVQCEDVSCADPASLCAGPRLVTSDLDQVRMYCVLYLILFPLYLLIKATLCIFSVPVILL